MKIGTEERKRDSNGAMEQESGREKRALRGVNEFFRKMKISEIESADEIPAQIEAICMAKLAEEISSDPEAMEYEGKTDQEVADLFNNPYSTEEIIVRTDGSTKVLKKPNVCRASKVFVGIPYAPGGVTPLDVKKARS